MYYRSEGSTPSKRHTQFRDANGNLYHEEMQGEEGFTSNQSFLYHRHIPTAITAARAVESGQDTLVANHPLLPRHIRTQGIGGGGDAVMARRLLVGNDDVSVRVCAATESGPLYRDAVGDQLAFVIAGCGVLESTYGSLPVEPGDYVVIPTSTTHRWVVSQGPLRLFFAEASGGGHIRVPKRYLSPMGQMLDGSPYCERDIRVPLGLLTGDAGEVEVYVRTREGLTCFTYAHHPFDLVGWDGYNYPWALSIRDFQPRTGAIHLPPSTYITFEGPGFVICSFVPRMFDYHPDALKVPYNHANVDSDEILLYWEGDFMSRADTRIGPGSISLHPAGFIHGPHPGSCEKSLTASETHEYAVMLDTFRPLRISDQLSSLEDPDYPWSWAVSEANAGLIPPLPACSSATAPRAQPAIAPAD